MVGSGEKRIEEKKLGIIKNFVMPQTKKEIKSFVGFISYYRSFCPMMSEIIRPMTDLLKKNEPDLSPINKEYIEAFQKIKDMLCSIPILQAPDFSKPFVIQSDAS